MPNLLFIGDIVGRCGREFVMKKLPDLREEWALDFVVANAENSAGGAGITAAIACDLKAAGIDAITLGDHTWDQRGFEREIDGLDWVCRPANLPESCPGRTSLIIEKDKFRLGVVTVLGRQYMGPKVSCPFMTASHQVEELSRKTDACLLEIHAEATSEKIAIGWYLDGRVAGVVGTHTHVPTADARILPKGTGYITDVGMSGPYASVLGRETQPVIERFLDGMPRRFPVAKRDVKLCGCVLKVAPETGVCESIRQLTCCFEEA